MPPSYSLPVQKHYGPPQWHIEVVAESTEYLPVERPRPSKGRDNRRAVGTSTGSPGPLEVIGLARRHVAHKNAVESANIYA